MIAAGTYNLTNAYVNGQSVTGTVSINSSYLITSTNLIFKRPVLQKPRLGELRPGLLI
jgi:hypothetical protein